MRPARKPTSDRRAADDREERDTRIDEMIARAKRRMTKIDPLPARADRVKGGLAKAPRKRP